MNLTTKVTAGYNWPTSEGITRARLRQAAVPIVEIEGNVNDLLAADLVESSMSALKAVDVSAIVDGFAVLLTGYYAVGDGGGGLFHYSASSVAVDDAGAVVAPNKSGYL